MNLTGIFFSTQMGKTTELDLIYIYKEVRSKCFGIHLSIYDKFMNESYIHISKITSLILTNTDIMHKILKTIAFDKIRFCKTVCYDCILMFYLF